MLLLLFTLFLFSFDWAVHWHCFTRICLLKHTIFVCDSFALQMAIIQIDYCSLTTMSCNKRDNHFCQQYFAKKIIEYFIFLHCRNDIIQFVCWIKLLRVKNLRFVARLQQEKQFINKPEMDNYLICIIQIGYFKLTLSIECFRFN